MRKIFISTLALTGMLFLFQHCDEKLDPKLAVVTTTAITAIIPVSATSGGEVVMDGGATVTARGVCWSTSANPTVDDDKTSDGSGTGVFVSSLIGLTGGTTYFVRAYATNSAGTAYGNEVEFTTSPAPTVPELSTVVVSNITANAASSGGSISSDGGEAVTSRGVCWSTTTAPTIANNKSSDGTGIGAFTSNLTGLSPATMYFVRAYATNSVGTAYGDEVSFSTASITATFFVVKDGSIFNNQAGTSPNGNYSAGASELLQVGYASPTQIYARTLVQFDLSSIPANSIIESVRLEFTAGSSGTNIPTIYVHKLNQSWTEGTTAEGGTNCKYNTNCNIQGVATTGVDATWNENSYSGTNSNPWSTLGGTFNGTSSAVSTDAGATSILYLATGLKDDVQNWVSNSSTNFGWLLKTDFITTTSAMRRFYSREGATASGNPATAPKLVVIYH